MEDCDGLIVAPAVKDLNELPLNRKAGEMLQRAGVAPDPACLHGVQLALWAIDSGVFEADEALAQTVRAMETWRPQRLTNFLMPDGEFFYGPRGWEEAADPSALARAILDDLDERVRTFFPWYLTAEW